MISVDTDTFRRPVDLTDRSQPAVLYALSYLLIRTVVGFVGVLLPIVLILGEAFFIRGGVHVRGSLSAYYHTSMRDVFVSSLCVAGIMLATYMSEKRNADFWLSLLAGVAVIGVVFFPTSRPGLTDTSPRCGSTPTPAGCSPVQQRLGESQTATIHFICAAVFILSLAAICFLFAYRARKYDHDLTMARLQRTCAVLILAAIAWAAIGGALHVTIWEITPLYLAEVVSVWAFGVSWLVKGRTMRNLSMRPTPGRSTGRPDSPEPATLP